MSCKGTDGTDGCGERMKCPEKEHSYEKITISSIDHIGNGWIVEDTFGGRLYFDYDRLNEALVAIGNGEFKQCTICGDILKY